MKKILKYFAISQGSVDELNDHAEDLMKDDPRWQPFGSLVVTKHRDFVIIYAQAFVIYEN